MFLRKMFKIERGLQRQAQSDLDKLGRRIGRWQGKYPSAAQPFDIVKDNQGRACGLLLTCPVRQGGNAMLSKGA